MKISKEDLNCEFIGMLVENKIDVLFSYRMLHVVRFPEQYFKA